LIDLRLVLFTFSQNNNNKINNTTSISKKRSEKGNEND
ncbi:MAG: hypothetical protein ACI90V_012578, partial [Bacillariaceae sp.]